MSKLLQERWLRLAGITPQERGSAPLINEMAAAAEADLSDEADEEILGLDSEDIWGMGLEGELDPSADTDAMDPMGEEV